MSNLPKSRIPQASKRASSDTPPRSVVQAAKHEAARGGPRHATRSVIDPSGVAGRRASSVARLHDSEEDQVKPRTALAGAKSRAALVNPVPVDLEEGSKARGSLSKMRAAARTHADERLGREEETPEQRHKRHRYGPR